MIESYVDLMYRGLPLARRVKLTSVRPREGYVEMPAPMPVGTQLQIGTDEGVAIEARVVSITEQTANATSAPGMQLAPVLAGPAAAWWSARVALPDAPPPARRVTPTAAPAAIAAPAPVARTVTAPMPVATVPPPAADPMDAETVPMPIIDGAPEPVEDERYSKRTTVMDAAVAETLLEQAEAEADAAAARSAPIVDDGKQTQVMAAVDLSALGLDGSASGSLRAITQSDTDPDGDKASSGAAGKKRRKRR